MIEVPDRHELDEASPQGPIVTSHRFAALVPRRKGCDPTKAVRIIPMPSYYAGVRQLQGEKQVRPSKAGTEIPRTHRTGAIAVTQSATPAPYAAALRPPIRLTRTCRLVRFSRGRLGLPPLRGSTGLLAWKLRPRSVG